MPSPHAPPLPFSPHYDFHVVKPLTLAGKRLTLGDPFPKGAVDQRRLRQLYEARMISPLPPAVLPINGADNGAAGVAGASNGAAGHVPPAGTSAAPSGPLRAQHKGFGKWFLVDAAGQEVDGPFAREEAERLAALSTA